MTIEYRTLTYHEINPNLLGLIEILREAVNLGATLSFTRPLPIYEARAYWEKVTLRVASDEIALIVAVEDEQIIGTAQVVYAWQPNAPHRAEIQKVIVRQSARRRGIASGLLQHCEATARASGRWLIFLNTEAGKGAVSLYENLGFVKAGVIPQFALNGEQVFADTIMYYKLLK